MSREAPGLARQTQLVGWQFGRKGWLTLNTDESRYSQTKVAASGGVLGDDGGNFVGGFTTNLGSCSIMRAELRATYEGMRLTLDKGVSKLRIQTDSKVAISLLSDPSRQNNQHEGLILQFHRLCQLNWEVEIEHIYCEANFSANYLANLGHFVPFGVVSFSVPDNCLVKWLRYDLLGVSLPRSVLN
ncbi:Putative ribonuclease H protein At1g65750 [Linum perenne]